MPGRTTRSLTDPKKNPEDVADTGDTDLQTKQQAILDSFLSEAEANRYHLWETEAEHAAAIDEMLTYMDEEGEDSEPSYTPIQPAPGTTSLAPKNS